MSATDNKNGDENSRIGPSIVSRNRSLGVQCDTIPKPASGFLQLLTLWGWHCPWLINKYAIKVSLYLTEDPEGLTLSIISNLAVKSS